MSVQPFTPLRCACKAWEQRWRAETPGWCSNCGLPFATGVAAREVCLKTPHCCLFPGHEGECYPVALSSSETVKWS